MVVRRSERTLEHHAFRELPDLLSPSDLLVINNTRVFPARLHGRKTSGARLEVLLLRELGADTWEALVRPSRRVKAGQQIALAPGFTARVLESCKSDRRLLQFEYEGNFWEWLEKIGSTPLPPYIDRNDERSDRERYQTVFARVRGSVAAPTAGLHLTPELLQRIEHCELTLHVGYGTFKPVITERVEDHKVEAEYYQISAETASRIQQQRDSQGRIVAVGTTTTRTLEYTFQQYGRIEAAEGWDPLFIYPGFQFKVVDALITNFHLPRSTLLLLVSAFAGKELVAEAYQSAIREKYRFYSYGDSMLIL